MEPGLQTMVACNDDMARGAVHAMEGLRRDSCDAAGNFHRVGPNFGPIF
jgi:hypothetical protein